MPWDARSGIRCGGCISRWIYSQIYFWVFLFVRVSFGCCLPPSPRSLQLCVWPFFFTHPFFLLLFYLTDVYVFESEWLVFIPSYPSRRLLIGLHLLAAPMTLVRPGSLRVIGTDCEFINLFCLSARQILQTPSNIIVTIAATRMYRLLVKFGSEQ